MEFNGSHQLLVKIDDVNSLGVNSVVTDDRETPLGV
jgi:hypothetical protein